MRTRPKEGIMSNPSALDVLGVLSANGEDAHNFIKAWHGGGEYDWLIAINQMRGQGGILKTIAAPVSVVLELLEEADLDELCYMDSMQWNLYHSAGFLNKKPEKGRRSGKLNIRGVPGVWLDLDVKGGSFSDETDALDFVHTLPIQPTILVATGTGGVQAYYRTDRILQPDEAEDLCVRWWRYAESICPVTIDKVQNRDRILRLPGSIRWPKGEEGPSLARLLSVDGPDVSPNRILDLTEPMHAAALQRKEQAYTELGQGRALAAQAVKDLGRWSVLWMITHIEETFNERYDWRTILEPMGWTVMGEDYDGRTVWCRPGGDRKSATTDWDESPHVMSLFSDAEETGLRRLADAEVALTKYRVYVELYWHGDEEGFVRAWVKQLQDEGKVE